MEVALVKGQQSEDAASLRQSARELIPMGICRGEEGRQENRGPVLKCSFSGWVSETCFHTDPPIRCSDYFSPYMWM